MIIKKIAVGNRQESFIEDKLTEGFNIISSDDNNKGKTIIIQSLMYALGNEPTFPSSFNHNEYYHYVEFEIENKLYKICRYDKTFILRERNNLMIFDNVAELKRYWSKIIFSLPQIIKNDVLRIVDPVLFYQIFFIGQDKKDTFNIVNAGHYNKVDFLNMLFSIEGLGANQINSEEIKGYTNQLKNLKEEKEILLKQNKILKSSKSGVRYLSSVGDKIAFENKIKELEKIQDKIAEFMKERNSLATRKTRWDMTLKELRSLNRMMDIGEIRCLDCNSTNISFSNVKKNSYIFDVSTAEMRSEIINSIDEKIIAFEEEIEKITLLINKEQVNMQVIMREDEITLESIVAYKNEIFDVSGVEEKIKQISDQIKDISNILKSNTEKNDKLKKKQELFLEKIINSMTDDYNEIDPNNNLKIDGLFTKKDKVFSGSESTIYYISKLHTFQKVFNHRFPIIIDSFRAEDLSTSKEQIVLEKFKKLKNQIIFTTTLKEQEFGKYEKLYFVNSIDYRSHIPNKILSDKYNREFEELISQMSLTMI